MSKHTTWSLVVPGLSPIRTGPSVSWATLGLSTFSDSFTICVTSTCQSLPRRKLSCSRASSSVAPLTSLLSATNWVKTRTVVLWYCAPQTLSVLSGAGTSPLLSVTLSFLRQDDKRDRKMLMTYFKKLDLWNFISPFATNTLLLFHKDQAFTVWPWHKSSAPSVFFFFF